MFDINELQQIVYFLNRTNLTGTESIAHATLLSKLNQLIQRENQSTE